MNITFETLPQAVSELSGKMDAILDLLSTKIDNNTVTTKLLDVNETISYLKAKGYVISKSTLYKYGCSGNIPCVKLGNRLCYDRDELDNWVNIHIQKGRKAKSASCAIKLIKNLNRY